MPDLNPIEQPEVQSALRLALLNIFKDTDVSADVQLEAGQRNLAVVTFTLDEGTMDNLLNIMSPYIWGPEDQTDGKE